MAALKQHSIYVQIGVPIRLFMHPNRYLRQVPQPMTCATFQIRAHCAQSAGNGAVRHTTRYGAG